MPSTGAQCFLNAILIFLAIGAFAQDETTSWADLRKKGKGTVTLYWYESQPFIYGDGNVMRGIEYEIFEAFREFVEATYDVELTVQWREGRSFADTYDRVRHSNEPGVFGVSAFSITPERQAQVNFSPPYMSDISVLITSKDIPIVQTRDEFNHIFSSLTAITIAGTTYEQDILRLKEEGKLPFDIHYIPSSENILRAVEARDSAFGFIDLPVYMMIFSDNPSVNVKRQNLFPVKRKGYAYIYPQASDWAEPLSAFFSDKAFAAKLETIISHYIDKELYHFVESLAIQSNEMVVLLTKEKEIQYNDLMGKYEQIEKETRTRNFLIALATIILVFLLIIIFLYRKRSQQKRQIDEQRKSIELQNQQLEKRNAQLIALDEEKSNLISILAHDLRAPINHVHGLAQVLMLVNRDLPDDQKELVHGIQDAAIRLNRMISNILDLDSIEQNRIKLSMEEVPLEPLIGQVVKTFAQSAARKNIQIHSAPINGVKIRGDQLFVTQVMENLVSNAVKFSEKGKEIRIRVDSRDNRVRISVQDSGPGIKQDEIPLLFRKFQKLSARPTDGENSTGLGLSIVKKYVELMDGQVWCESSAGKGATFFVEFEKA